MRHHHPAGDSAMGVPAIFLALSIAMCACSSQPEPQTGNTPWGINLAGAEFGEDVEGFSAANPGRFDEAYTWNSEATIAYFAGRGLHQFRVPFRWERLQPVPGGELNPVELGHLRQLVGWAAKHNSEVILDLHNYGRYVLDRDGAPFSVVIDQRIDGAVPVTRSHFADLWARLSAVFQDEPVVWAYGLMNEPHDMGGSSWKLISQAAVDAIRGRGDTKRILVAGDRWSSAAHWRAANGAVAWIDDPVDRTLYEAHLYIDSDGSGKYRASFDNEMSRDPGFMSRPIQRLEPFITWCRENRVQGFLGEFGVPVRDPRWAPLLETLLARLSAAGMGGTYWAAGEWWGTYPLSLQPTEDFQDAPELLDVLLGVAPKGPR